MKVELTDQVAIVTGASSGIGEATAELLAANGAKVVAVGRDEARLTAVADRITQAGGEVHTVVADLADAAAPAAVVEQAVARYGRIDAIVNAAGVFHQYPLADAPLESFELQWAIHVRAPYLITQAALPHLSEGASVVFVSSTTARAGFADCAAYSATKGAVDAMGRALAAELAPKVRVNVVAPGFALSPMVTVQIDAWPEMTGELERRTPVGFVGVPQDIAHAIVFLCTPEARYIAGQVMVVDGGWTAQAWQA